MTKQVHKREMVAHLWAHQTQDSARVAGGNFWFTGATLYSYGPHFVCAYHMPAEYAIGGRPVALLNADKYSATTNRHMHAARQALPGYVVRVDVPGLDENMVRGISRYGCGDVVAALLSELRTLADKAANPRIRPDTRGALFRNMRSIRAHALHLASVDAGRRDLDAERRKAARATARMLSALAIPDDGADKAVAEALAYELNKAKYAERMAEHIRRAERAIECAVYEAERGNFTAAECYIVDADRAAGFARDFAQKARRELPRAFVREWRKYAPGTEWRAELASKARAEAVAEARAVWAREEALAREALAHEALAAREFHIVNRFLAGEARSAFETLRGEPGDDERAAVIADVAAAAQRWHAMGELERAREELAAARGAYAAGKFTRAHEAARSAARTFHRYASGASPDDAQALADAEALAADAEARKPAEYAAQLADWRDSKPGVHFPAALHTRDRVAFLRLSADGQRVETSRGAEVPASVCPLVWRLVGEVRASGEPRTFAPGSVRLGHFSLDSIDAEGNVRAGCHSIPFTELADIASRLGYAPHI